MLRRHWCTPPAETSGGGVVAEKSAQQSAAEKSAQKWVANKSAPKLPWDLAVIGGGRPRSSSPSFSFSSLSDADGGDDDDYDDEYDRKRRELKRHKLRLRKAEEALREDKAMGSVKIKEADTIKVPPCLTRSKTALGEPLRRQVTAASGRGEAALQWVMAVEHPDALREDFQGSPSFESLYAKLVAALAS